MPNLMLYINFAVCILLILNGIKTYLAITDKNCGQCKEYKLFITSLISVNGVLSALYIILQLIERDASSFLESFKVASFVLLILILNAILVLLRRI